MLGAKPVPEDFVVAAVRVVLKVNNFFHRVLFLVVFHCGSRLFRRMAFAPPRRWLCRVLWTLALLLLDVCVLWSQSVGSSRAGARVTLSFETLSSTPSLSTVTEVLSTFKTLCAVPALRVSLVIVS